MGTKVTGITRRQFKPNLQRVRVTAKGTHKTMRVCTQCLRSGAVTKQVQAAPVQAARRRSRQQGESQGKRARPQPGKFMSLSREEVEKVSLLARLRLSDEELDG